MTNPLDLPRFESPALCATEDPDLFFPPADGRGHEQAKNAKAVCNGADGKPPCPARAECLAYALPRWRVHGVWGGTSEKERAKWRASQAREAS